MEKVIVGMSGGVDSAAAALILKKAGYDVIGVMLRTWEADGAYSRCCDIDDAADVARKLGIPFHAPNCVSVFQEKVIEPFIDSYVSGQTPNPCVACNRYVKWDKLLYMANVLQAEYIATGHYASIVKLENGRYTLKKAAEDKKDQTYMLYRLTQEELKRTLMPLGRYSKDEVRALAEEAGLSVAKKPESQDICFVHDGDYASFIEGNLSGAVSDKGNFVDEDGNILGEHKGIIHYTVGQRKGLGLPLGYPAYVKEIRAGENEVVVAKEESLFTDTVICDEVNFIGIEGLKDGEKLRCSAKIRYRHSAKPATVEAVDGKQIKIVFDEPVKSAAPGQSAVLYDGDCLIGGGVIKP